MTEEKKMKIEFAPGCFDNFEGSQEELDEMITEIQNLFNNKSREELEAMSRPISIDDLLDDENILEALVRSENPQKRNLQ